MVRGDEKQGVLGGQKFCCNSDGFVQLINFFESVRSEVFVMGVVYIPRFDKQHKTLKELQKKNM